MSRLLKVRNYEFHVVVQPLSDGGFTYTCVEVDLSRTKKISEIRYDSHLRFETEDEAYEQESMIPLGAETHGGDDVAVFARGPGSAAVHGSMEENALFHVIAQNADAIRAQLCRLGSCDANGVPVKRPTRERLLAARLAKP